MIPLMCLSIAMKEFIFIILVKKRDFGYFLKFSFDSFKKLKIFEIKKHVKLLFDSCLGLTWALKGCFLRKIVFCGKVFFAFTHLHLCLIFLGVLVGLEQ